jgi:dTDP-4-amino-4,6-dideoxygalactose transaminase
LSDIKGISFQNEIEGAFSNRWLTTILIDPTQSGFDREQLRLALEKENIESRPLWKPMHLQPVFKSFPSFSSGVSEKLFESGLCLPSGSNLTVKQLSGIVAVIKKLSAIS